MQVDHNMGLMEEEEEEEEERSSKLLQFACNILSLDRYWEPMIRCCKQLLLSGQGGEMGGRRESSSFL